jgi:hypothetical protein
LEFNNICIYMKVTEFSNTLNMLLAIDYTETSIFSH